MPYAPPMRLVSVCCALCIAGCAGASPPAHDASGSGAGPSATQLTVEVPSVSPMTDTAAAPPASEPPTYPKVGPDYELFEAGQELMAAGARRLRQEADGLRPPQPRPVLLSNG